jgi:hypothetical protein
MGYEMNDTQPVETMLDEFASKAERATVVLMAVHYLEACWEQPAYEPTPRELEEGEVE